MANYVKGVVLASSLEGLSIRLVNNVIVCAKPRPELGYMDPVLVAYDFSTYSVKEVLTPDELPNINIRPERHVEEGEETGDEEHFGNLLASRMIEEFE